MSHTNLAFEERTRVDHNLSHQNARFIFGKLSVELAYANHSEHFSIRSNDTTVAGNTK